MKINNIWVVVRKYNEKEFLIYIAKNKILGHKPNKKCTRGADPKNLKA
jgi:hypothetical protein